MRLTAAEHDAITYQQLMSFMARADLSGGPHLRDLLADALREAGHPAAAALLEAALAYGAYASPTNDHREMTP